MGGGPPSPSPSPSLSDRSSGDAVSVSHRVRTMQQDPLGAGAGYPQSDWAERGTSYDGEEGGEAERARLLWSKSKVYLHPTSYLRDNIPGFLSIVHLSPPSRFGAEGRTEGGDYLLSWIPELVLEGTADYDSYVLVELASSPNETLVQPPPPHSPHSFSIPIRSLYSLLLQPPTLSAWFGSVTFAPFSSSEGEGEEMPPLYFHDEESHSTVLDRDRRAAALGALGAGRGAEGDRGGMPAGWGGEALLTQLRMYAKVVRSQLEPTLFLVNPSRADLEVHSNAIWEDEAVPVGALRGLRVGEGDGAGRGDRRSILHQSLDRGGGGEFPDDLAAGGGGDGGMDNFTFNVLSSFSRITRGARSAASQVLSHPLAKPLLPSLPPPIAQYANSGPGELARVQESAGVGAYDAARVYLAKWARVVAEEGERARRAEVVIAGPNGGREDAETGAFEVLSSTYRITRPKSTRASSTPVVDTEWAAWFDDEGRLMLDEGEAKKRVFQRGLAHDVRREVWPFLLNVFPWDSSLEERKVIRAERTSTYDKLKAKWANDDELQKTDRWVEESHRVEIDCRRTDRTHPMFASDSSDPYLQTDAHPPSNAHVKSTQEILLTYVFAEPGRDYVQGMSDLLSPIYVVCEGDQTMAYWCFETLMGRMKDNFLRDQSGMKRQLSLLQGLIRTMDVQLYQHLEACGSLNLFFCFRWLLCSFKRELSFEQTLQLWEVLWTDYLGTHFHLFVALAIIEAHRDVIIRYLREFDEVLKYITQLSQTLDIEAIMADAEVLFVTFRQVVQASDAQRAVAASSHDPEKGGMRRRNVVSAEEGAAYPPTSATAKGKSRESEKEEGAQVKVENVPEVDEELRVLLS